MVLMSLSLILFGLIAAALCSLFDCTLHAHLAFIYGMRIEESGDQKTGEAGHQDWFQDQ